MIHEAMILEYSGRRLAFIEWGAAVKQLVLMALVANLFFPAGLPAEASPAALAVGLAWLVAKLMVLAGAVVLVEFTNAKLRLFRVPDLLSAAFVLAMLALVSAFLYR
jgi:formate hydrogenlyase subunit 4